MKVIQTVNLNKTYGKGDTFVHPVNNVNLEVEEGEFVAVVGASGGGKSTLLHLLGGLDIPTSGTVYLNGKDIYAMRNDERAIFRRRNIGFVFQFFNLIPVLTAEENIKLPTSLDNIEIDKEMFDEIIKQLGLTDRLNHFPSQLSGGEQQRVSIGRALINKPSIILADEPTGNLDKKNSQEILNLLKLFGKKYGITVVMITHDLSLAAAADRIIKIEDGKIMGA
ncbi:ABC transporter ATP-binding protein [Helcococcus ovis]|uniref:ABC transporter ATP-binding protein n=1 Tax=Helcococcus ovis TaxID=72026 RepID=A0A4V3IY79_9FIRM|nr:ABC transporter ATP-binding protein [Helcococcus ovis]TFF64712.1 ABC transporter ATP-binding protein [Helcococcus ovis]TFF65585.1 ABC transporter ATP-binding protein [Helcococcus ovis]TFF68181.1 ABC transporter ATP-binding protein [Helcococcus ovis]WNZ01481.1 ABC transporter ATP-binding protein [Helcococcus ovis]